MIYLDNAATTRLLPGALEEMMPFLTGLYGNPSALCAPAMRSRAAVEKARERIAATIGASPSEIYFTSGGTEADNWALSYCFQHRCGLVTSRIEHHAVLRAAERLEKQGTPVAYVSPEEDGTIRAEDVSSAMTRDTGLVSVMAANNEIGTVEDLKSISEAVHRKGALFHTDAVQAYGHIPIHVDRDGIDLMSASAHKLHGPKGIGFLYIRKGVSLGPFHLGGAQERGRRAGTENTAGIVGFGAAAGHMHKHMEEYAAKETELREYAFSIIRKKLRGVRILGNETKRLPGNICLLLPGVEGERILALLDRQGICASSGSACAAGAVDPSHVLLAIGVPYEQAFGELRLSLSFETNRGEIDRTIEVLEAILNEDSPCGAAIR